MIAFAYSCECKQGVDTAYSTQTIHMAPALYGKHQWYTPPVRIRGTSLNRAPWKKSHNPPLLTFACPQQPRVGVRSGLPKSSTAEPSPQQETAARVRQLQLLDAPHWWRSG